MKKLSIISLFCDKDYQYVSDLLKNIDKKVICNFELILIDNREKFKDTSIPSISSFQKYHNCKILSKGKNLCQLSAKKLALSVATGDYIWFVDGDDGIEDTISNIILNLIEADIVSFNYVHNFIPEDKIVYQEKFKNYKISNNTLEFKNDKYLQNICPTCWNKWFKKDILDDIFINIPEGIKVSCNEDVFICCSSLKRAQSVQEIPFYIYTNFPRRGISGNPHISSIEDFKTILTGWKESMRLFKREFPENCELFNYEYKEETDISYFLGRVNASDVELWDEEIIILFNIFTPQKVYFINNKYLKSIRLRNYLNLKYSTF